MKTWKIWLAVLMLAASPGIADEHEVTDFDRFRLWNDCKPLHLLVESLDENATDIDLTADQIAITVRSRLRAARLYAGTLGAPYLYVNINVGLRAFSVSVEYKKEVFDLATGLDGIGATWERAGMGTHGGDAAFILSNLAGYTDAFIDEYLRVNEEACAPASRQ